MRFDAKKLSKLRKAARLREDGLLRKARMTQSQLRACAAGRYELTLAELIRLASAVGVEPSALVRD